ncbi:MAG: SET domain-containing protein [Okeania sp. SIO3H1]|uniref:SET domain-containing protein-lysine N-methyltransferase n=1 Tax=Okeania sp. SIO1I7 TaxID=2607772 RepID=UPI0013C5D495|nr:SET domain-containing protein-lysine N-methyltransferase [Okeania sp. SIO1I7]NEN90496.1 SET domain-containing protein [Okeania sp. SIO3H1]NET26027.1 SET domain-containing protein [Okeania sp. SIO1I7]
MIEVKKIQNKGRGIMATQDIPQGTLMEVAPVEIFPFEPEQTIDETGIFKYYFVSPLEYDKSKNVNRYLVFGLASFCNHAEKPNSHVEWVENAVGLWAHLIAQKDIKEGEEVTLFYTNIDEYADAQKFV